MTLSDSDLEILKGKVKMGSAKAKKYTDKFLSEALVEYLNNRRLEMELTKHDFCQFVGFNQNTFSLKINGRNYFSLADIFKICIALDVSAEKLMQEIGL